MFWPVISEWTGILIPQYSFFIQFFEHPETGVTVCKQKQQPACVEELNYNMQDLQLKVGPLISSLLYLSNLDRRMGERAAWGGITLIHTAQD
jgi:hypothetical protein